jgi:hypothetical protein
MKNIFRNPAPTPSPVVNNEKREVEDVHGEKGATTGYPSAVVKVEHPVDDNGSEEGFTPDAQDGVKKMEATTKMWTTKHLIAAYIL